MSSAQACFPIGTPLGRRQSTPIHTPGARLQRALPFRFLHRASGARARPRSFDLNLTAMIDFLVVTVVFLLNQFGASQANVLAHVEMPSAVNTSALTNAPIVTVTRSAVLYNNARVASVAEASSATDRIDGLYERMLDTRTLFAAANPQTPFEGLVVFQVERETPWAIMRRVLGTAAQAGYTTPQLAVNTRSAPNAR